MLTLFGVLTLLSAVLLIFGTISPRLALPWGATRTRRRSITVYGSSTLVLVILLTVTSMHASSKAPTMWNTTDINANSNGNIPLAVQWLKADPQNIRSMAASSQSGTVYKKPWQYYGQIVRLTGKVVSIQSYPPGAKLSKTLGGPASEITLVAKDGTDIDFLVAGSNVKAKSGDTVSVYGYPVGHDNVTDKSGVRTKDLVLVGTAIDDPV